MNLYKTAKRIIAMSIADMILTLAAIIVVIVSVTAIPMNTPDNLSFTIIIGIAFAVLLFVIGFILWLIATIMVFATEWNNPKLLNDRILWGLLSLFILGPIATLVFGVQAKNCFSSAA